jgi:hypothetical protein
MSVEIKKIAGVPRIVESETGRIARSKNGFAMDGGRKNASSRGFSAARRQVGYINKGVTGAGGVP